MLPAAASHHRNHAQPTIAAPSPGPSPLCLCSEIELAQIALELDAAERALMASGGVESAEYLQ